MKKEPLFEKTVMQNGLGVDDIQKHVHSFA